MNKILKYIFPILLITSSFANAQDWENFTEREKRLYLLGWHGVIESSTVKIWQYLISHKGSTGRCPSYLVMTLSDIADSLVTYHFRPTDIDSLIYLTDKIFSEITSKNFRSDVVEPVLREWGNRHKYEDELGSIVLWSELDSTEKVVYIEGWLDGSFLTWGEILEIGSHFALENTKFQRAMKELSVSGYEEDCIVVIMEGVADLWDILYMSHPNISGYYNKRYALISLLDKNIKNSQEDEQPLSDRTTILSIAEGIKIWNSKSKKEAIKLKRFYYCL